MKLPCPYDAAVHESSGRCTSEAVGPDVPGFKSLVLRNLRIIMIELAFQGRLECQTDSEKATNVTLLCRPAGGEATYTGVQ